MAETDAETSTTEKTPEPKPAPRRSPEEVAAELEVARQSLVMHVEAIKHELSPAELARRPINHVRRIFVDADGKPKTRTVAITAAVVVVYVIYRIRR